MKYGSSFNLINKNLDKRDKEDKRLLNKLLQKKAKFPVVVQNDLINTFYNKPTTHIAQQLIYQNTKRVNIKTQHTRH